MAKKNDMTKGFYIKKKLRALKQVIKDKGKDFIKYNLTVIYTAALVCVVIKVIG